MSFCPSRCSNACFSILCSSVSRLPKHIFQNGHNRGHRCTVEQLRTAASQPQRLQGALSYQEESSTRLHRFYVRHSLRESHGLLALEQDEGRHAIKALRLTEGSQVELCDGLGTTLVATVTAVEKSACRALLEPVGAPVYHPWQGPSITLAVACTTLKGGRTDWLVEKACELGARELVPLITARSQPAVTGNKYKPAGKGKSEGKEARSDGSEYAPGRLERVSIAATKQSLRTHGMVLHPPVSLEDFLPRLEPASLSLVAAAGAESFNTVALSCLHRVQRQPTKDWIGLQGQQGQCAVSDEHGSSSQQPGQDLLMDTGVFEQQQPSLPAVDVVLLVGPEGDWTPVELGAMVGAGAEPVNLGKLRLRTETASISLLAAVSNMLCV